MVRTLSFLLLILVLGLAACAPAAPPGDAMLEKTPEAMGDAMMEATPEALGDAMLAKTPEAMGDAMMEATPAAMGAAMLAQTPEAMGDAMMEAPAWFGAALTDVNTGGTFMLADFAGQVVLVETLAVWCPKCLEQQRQVQALHGQLGERDDFVSVGLNIDPNETAEILRGHTTQHGFGWRFAVAPADVARAIANLYGDQFLNPPSTPMLIIDRHGAVHVLPFGLKSAAALQDALAPFLNEAL